MAKKNFALLVFVFITFTSIANGQTGNPVPAAESKILFTENKGQWTDVVTYRAEVPGGTVFLEKNGFTYALVSHEDMDGIHPPKKEIPADGLTIRMHALKVKFLNALNTRTIAANKKAEGYSNYYVGNDATKWAGNVLSYKEITYRQLYTGINMKVYSLYNAFKYDLIVAPNANSSIIKIEYSGADDLKVIGGELKIATSVGTVTEQKPYAYQVINGSVVVVPCNYALQGNILGFEFPKGYDSNYELVIDPTLIFSTLSGSVGDNWGFTATYDDAGNFYTGGVALATGYPVTAGAYQTTWRGGGAGGGNGIPFDATITKYNPTGTARIYSTYLGGTDNDFPTSLVVNKSGELYVLGRTYSSTFPVTSGAFRTTLAGAADIFITHFNAAGSALIGSTFVGGSGDDGVNITASFTTMNTLKYNYGDDFRSDIIVDVNDNVYVANCTRSTNFPAVNSFQAALSGLQDGVVFKMNGNLTTMQWSSYIGGSGSDGAYGIALNTAGDVYITGGTNSTNFPVTAGAYHSTNAGGIDGFIAKIPNAGGSISNCTYLGTTAYDQTYLIQVDKAENVYVAGQTQGAYPVSQGVYSNPNSPQFIQKFNPSLSTSLFSTVIGNGIISGANMSLTAFLVDICGNIYLSGWGRSCLPLGSYPSGNITGMPITANAFQKVTNGCNFYFIQLSPNAQSLLYGSYFGDSTFGEEHVDGGTSRFDKNGVIYQSVCAACGGYVTGFPTTPGVVSTTNGSSNCNNGSIKMKFDNNFVSAGYITPNGNKGCSPLSVSFQNTSQLGSDFIWSFGDNTSSTAASPSHVYTTPGTYTVRLIANNQATCNISDTTYGTVIVYPLASVNAGPDAAICKGGSTTIGTSSGAKYTYSWSPVSGLTSPTTATPTASPSITTTYIVTAADSNGCQAKDTVKVTVNSVTATVSPNAVICIGDSTQLTASGGAFYSWSPVTGLSNGSIANPKASPAATTTYTVTVSDSSECGAKVSVKVTVNPLPVVTFPALPNACVNAQPFPLTGGSPAGGTYSGAGVTGNTFDPAAAGIGTHKLTYSYTDVNGCSNTASNNITVDPAGTVTIDPIADLCVNATSITLTGSPAGGTFSGPGVTGNTFNPAIAGTGTHTITYTFNASSCLQNTSASTTVTVTPAITVTINAVPDLCVNATAVTLSGSPSGGTFSGTGVSGNTFDPAVAGAGPHIITYTYNGSDCQSNTSATTTVIVNPGIEVTINNIPDLCVNANAVTLSGSPAGGTFSGTGVSGNTFDPAVAGAGTFTITYTYTNGTCLLNTTATTTVTVNPGVTVTISTIPDLCLNAAAVTLSGSPVGGTFSGPGVSGTTFNPSSAGLGLHTITYTYTNGTCLLNTTASTTVNVIPTVTVTINSIPDLCSNANAVTLSGSPAGGTFSGPGVTGNTFNPASAGAGTHTITYTYNGSTCQINTSASTTVTVNAAGVVSIASIPDICITGNPVTLVGTPSGGTFSGPGVSGNIFDPSVAGAGTHTITYTYTGSSCLQNTTASTTVTVGPKPTATVQVSPPDGCNGSYLNSAVLTAQTSGNVTSYQWYLNGSPISGATSSTYTATKSGWYNVIVSLNGCVSDSANGNNIKLIDGTCGHVSEKKMVICHVPDCRYDKQVTICIGIPAIPAHLKNHPCDCLGPCDTPHPNKREMVEIDMSGIEVSVVPNPFRKEGILEFYISDPAYTTVEIYDVKGSLVSKPFEQMAEGDLDYSVKITGLGEGVYIARLQSGDFIKHVKMVVTK